jgi:hypothetical protein
MRLYTGNIGTRVAGTALGIGFLAIGIFAVSVSGNAPDVGVGDRAFWMGATFAFAGLCAVAVSWLVQDLSNIWCRPPARFLRSPRGRR